MQIPVRYETYAANDNSAFHEIWLTQEECVTFIYQVRFDENLWDDDKIDWCKNTRVDFRIYFRRLTPPPHRVVAHCHYCFNNQLSATKFVMSFGGVVIVGEPEPNQW